MSFWLVQVLELIHGENWGGTNTLFPSISPFGSYVFLEHFQYHENKTKEWLHWVTLKFSVSEKRNPTKEFFVTETFFLAIVVFLHLLHLCPNYLSIAEKVMLTIKPLEWLVATDIIFDRNVGGKAY